MSGFESPNYTQAPNDLFDTMMKDMGEAELKVVLVFIRNTFGWHRDKFQMSIGDMAKITGLTPKSVRIGAKKLEERGLISRINDGYKTTYWLRIPTDGLLSNPSNNQNGLLSNPQSGLNKDIKEIKKRRADFLKNKNPRVVVSEQSEQPEPEQSCEVSQDLDLDDQLGIEAEFENSPDNFAPLMADFSLSTNSPPPPITPASLGFDKPPQPPRPPLTSEEYKERVKTALLKHESRQLDSSNASDGSRVAIENFLAQVPENLRGLALPFLEFMGRPPTKSEKSYWFKCWNMQAEIGLTGEHIRAGIRDMLQVGLSIKSPQSVNVAAEKIKREKTQPALYQAPQEFKKASVMYVKRSVAHLMNLEGLDNVILTD